jgi:hypothetical protein
VLGELKMPTQGEPAATGGRIDRLTTFDLMFLRLESNAWPCHFGGLATLDAGVLLGADGALKMPEILERLDRRVAQTPKLKRRIHRPGRLGGRPVWVDDPRFDIRNHVHAMTIAPPEGPQSSWSLPPRPTAAFLIAADRSGSCGSSPEPRTAASVRSSSCTMPSPTAWPPWRS